MKQESPAKPIKLPAPKLRFELAQVQVGQLAHRTKGTIQLQARRATALVSVLLLLLTGCLQVPATRITVPLANGKVAQLIAPKDSNIEGLSVDFHTGTLTVKRYSARMNPDVIGSTAQGQVELLKGYALLLQSAMEMGLKAAAASQGVPIGTSNGELQVER